MPALALVFNAFTWGVSWWPFRQLEQRGLHPLWVTATTYLVAVAVLLLARPRALLEVLRTPTLWVLVVAAGTTNATFNWAVTVGDVVRVVLLFYLMPLWAVLLARPLLGERIHPQALLRVALALAGALVVLWPTDGHGSLALSAADALALLGGFSFALNNVMLRRESQRSESARAMAMFGGGAVVSLAVALLLTHSGQASAPPAPTAVVVASILALAAWFLASNLALQFGAARLAAHTTAVVMITEVFFASGSAIALGAGHLNGQNAVGGVLIVSAAALAAWQGD
ncbi:MAG: DMT family transporter [Ideonella sp.]|nr:DMT family transporter [Ideonella sp.]